jgi:exopolyphosphatase/guanosine-5'-triphosphate,3'-diphosphate pyrophosphatase
MCDVDGDAARTGVIMSLSRRLAAIDIGTVTTRLLVADVGPHSILEVGRSTDITQLGEGLTLSGRLSDEAIERVVTVVRGYVATMRELGVEHFTALATSASRDAANGAEFVRLLEVEGVALQIISGLREAELSFLGATAQRAGEGLLVVDCGGGSTELIVGSVTTDEGERISRIDSARSIDVGSRRMTELYLRSDPPSRAELDAARAWAVAELRGYFDRLVDRPRELIALAGTATSLAAIELGLERYDPARVHGYELSGSHLSDLLEMLAALPVERRRRVVGLHPQRAGVIVAGALILETVLALAGLDRIVVSEHDLLYGILLDTYHDLREQP